MSTTKATAAQNGAAPAIDLPVDSYRDAAPLLRRPFFPAAVKFKVQASWASGALIVSYIDARLAAERLNLVCPHLWHDAYEPTEKGLMWCYLTVDGITRRDVGEGYQGKGLVSDAFKRAAVKFGVGVSLYAIPKLMLNDADGLKRQQRGGKEQVILTDAGERTCRKRYGDWLDSHGAQAFGEPLDHGDAEDAAGDHEAEPEQVAPDVPDPAITTLRQLANDAVKAKAITRADVKLLLTANGATDASDIATLPPEGVQAVGNHLMDLMPSGAPA